MTAPPNPDGLVIGDAFGEAMLAHLEHGGSRGDHVVERDDGWVDAMRADLYFQAASQWTLAERDGLSKATGRVLDVGAGAGRHALWIQGRGHDVVALDVSPGVVEVCERRGVRQTFVGTVSELAATGVEPFDAFVLMGNNLGLLESAEHAGRFLGTIASIAKPGALLIGEGIDPHQPSRPGHARYVEQNTARGRMPGQVRIRVRWESLATDWFDYLLMSLGELAELAEPAGWTIEEHYGEPPTHVAVLRYQG